MYMYYHGFKNFKIYHVSQTCNYKFVQRDKKENQCKARTRDPYSLTDWATRKDIKFRLNENYKWKVIFIGFLFKGIKYVK